MSYVLIVDDDEDFATAVATVLRGEGPDARVELAGVADREVLPVIVLNGSGVPGIGELAAERLIPGGLRVVVSENASSFDHETTLVVVPSEAHRALGKRVRDLLGVGEVQVAGPASGLAGVTIVVGKDFGA